MARIALVDDHTLLRKGLAALVRSLGHTVVTEAANGREFIQSLERGEQPELVLMDINMPEMDGYETTLWLKNNHPGIAVMALSMYDTETAIIKMIKNGAKGYILKDSDPSELTQALNALFTRGYYYSELVNSKMMNVIGNLYERDNEIKNAVELSDLEIELLKFICTELTYKEIADKMRINPHTLDNHRENLFEKLNVKSRIGLAMFAVRTGVVQL